MPPRVQNRKEPAWSAVVLLLIFFWPVGLYLLYRKLSIPPISRQGGVALLIVGTVFAAFGVLDIIKRTTGWPPSLGETDFFFSSVFYTGVSVGIGLICLLAGGMLLHKRRVYQRYAPFLLGHVTTSLDAVAQAWSRDYLRVSRELQYLINAGCLSSAYLDYTHRLFVFSRQWLPSPPPPPSGSGKGLPVGTPEDPDAAQLLDRIRALNETIRDPQLSNRIYQIEGLCEKIFQVVESQPEKQPQIRSFMQYYLPATLRLLDTYSALEAQRVRGETIDEAMRGVEEMAGTLAEAFKKQLDRLFTGEALDVSAEIRVLETMLRRDGLMGDDPFSAPPDTKDL